MARGSYAALALLAPPFILYGLRWWFVSVPAHTGADFLNMLWWPVFTLCALVAPALRVWWRKLRGGQILPADLLVEKPGVGIAVGLCSFIALVLAVLSATVLPGMFDVVHGETHPVTCAMMAAALLSGVALLLGELVLIGREE